MAVAGLQRERRDLGGVLRRHLEDAEAELVGSGTSSRRRRRGPLFDGGAHASWPCPVLAQANAAAGRAVASAARGRTRARPRPPSRARSARGRCRRRPGAGPRRRRPSPPGRRLGRHSSSTKTSTNARAIASQLSRTRSEACSAASRLDPAADRLLGRAQQRGAGRLVAAVAERHDEPQRLGAGERRGVEPAEVARPLGGGEGERGSVPANGAVTARWKPSTPSAPPPSSSRRIASRLKPSACIAWISRSRSRCSAP